MKINTERFTGKAESYDKYRPSYPDELMDYLYGEVGFSAEKTIADIGAGTGKFTELLLKRGSRVYAVEPNADMSGFLTQKFSGYENFAFISAPAESTTLPDNSVDFITVAQAFHWFDAVKFKAECQRILKPDGKVALIWNSRDDDSNIVKAYDEACRKFCPDFKGNENGRRGKDPKDYGDFFRDGICEFRVFDGPVGLTLDHFIGAAVSASYAPNEDDEIFPAFKAELTGIFNKYNQNNILKMPFFTMCYIGQV